MGPLPGARILPCPDEPACVRLEHLSVFIAEDKVERTERARKGAGSMSKVGPSTWKLTVTVGEYANGQRRRISRRVHVPDANAAARELAIFVSEAQGQAPVVPTGLRRDITVDEAIDLFLTEYLGEEKGRDERTIHDYRALHRLWFSPYIGGNRVRDVNEAMLDKLFGRMRKAGLSRSRLNQAKSLYNPFFRWAKRRGSTTRAAATWSNGRRCAARSAPPTTSRTARSHRSTSATWACSSTDIESAQYDVNVSYPGATAERTTSVFTFCTSDGKTASCEQ